MSPVNYKIGENLLCKFTLLHVLSYIGIMSTDTFLTIGGKISLMYIYLSKTLKYSETLATRLDEDAVVRFITFWLGLIKISPYKDP